MKIFTNNKLYLFIVLSYKHQYFFCVCEVNIHDLYKTKLIAKYHVFDLVDSGLKDLSSAKGILPSKRKWYSTRIFFICVLQINTVLNNTRFKNTISYQQFIINTSWFLIYRKYWCWPHVFIGNFKLKVRMKTGCIISGRLVEIEWK
jgi:hypothetical protein